MGNFCKGVVLGMIAGACVGAVVVAKNKKLSNKLKEGLITAEGKLKEVKDSIEEKLNQSSCGCETGNYDMSEGNCGSFDSENCEQIQKNNFSKKNKND